MGLALPERPSQVHPVLTVTAIRMSKAIGLGSFGYLAHAASSWCGAFELYVGDEATAETAWHTGFGRTVPYPVSSLCILGIVCDYLDLWGIPRAPTSYSISNEYACTPYRGGMTYFPGAGDEIIMTKTPLLDVAPNSPYPALLTTTMMQASRVALPLPTGFKAVLSGDAGLSLTEPIPLAEGPNIHIDQRLYWITNGTMPSYSWRNASWISPYWEAALLHDSIKARLESRYVTVTPSCGIEAVGVQRDDSNRTRNYDATAFSGSGWQDSEN